jgi:hypothetical protein
MKRLYIKIALVYLRKAKIPIPYLNLSHATPKVEISTTFLQAAENLNLKFRGGVQCWKKYRSFF